MADVGERSMNSIKNTVEKALREAFPGLEIKVSVDERQIVTLAGECGDWQQLIDVGHRAANVPGVENVVSDMWVKGLEIPRKDYQTGRAKGFEAGLVGEADVVIAGAGVIGCGIARELAKYPLKIIVVEKNDDVCTGASKANNGNIHPGHAAKTGTLKARLNILGNRMYDRWADELGFVFQRNGLMYIAWEEAYIPALKERYDKGVENGVDGI